MLYLLFLAACGDDPKPADSSSTTPDSDGSTPTEDSDSGTTAVVLATDACEAVSGGAADPGEPAVALSHLHGAI